MRSQVTRRLEFRGLSLVEKEGETFYVERKGFPFSRCVHAITRGLSDWWNNKIPGREWRIRVKEIFWMKKLKILALKICFKKEKGITLPYLLRVDQLFQMVFIDERSYRTLAATMM